MITSHTLIFLAHCFEGRLRQAVQANIGDEHVTTCSADTTVANRITEHNVHQKRAYLASITAKVAASHARGRPACDQLLQVIQLNMFNGLQRNASMIGLDVDWLICASISPFGFAGPRMSAEVVPAGLTCPDNLVPTNLQSTMAHHPWIDLFPLPRLRDNMLRALYEDLPDEEGEKLWNDLMESTCDENGHWNGLIIWGEPYNAANWELSDTFLRTWSCLIEGCPELIQSTNHWRSIRGEDCLPLSNGVAHARANLSTQRRPKGG